MNPDPPRTPALPSDSFSPYAGPTWRRRLLLALLAAATAVTVVLLLLDPPGGPVRKRPAAAPDAPPCSQTRQDGCVGSMTSVLVPPAGPGSSAGR